MANKAHECYRTIRESSADKDSSIMKPVFRCLLAVVMLMLAGFCVFGFLASFEPTDNAMVFRIGYAVMGVSCLAGSGGLIVSVIHNRP